MKKVSLSMLAIVVAFTALPVFAAVPTPGKSDCLLYGKNCRDNANDLPVRIANLKTEIAKGEKIYTPEELKFLEGRLKEDNELMRWFQRPR